jgi:general secretion pathway protein J
VRQCLGAFGREDRIGLRKSAKTLAHSKTLSRKTPPSEKSALNVLGRRAGFTLIELVISAAVMSLVLAASYLCLNSGIAGQKLIESRADATQRARVALAMISADLRSACSMFQGPVFLGMDRLVGEVESDNLDFATHNYDPKTSTQGDYCEVSYFLSKDPQTEEWALYRRRDATPDEEPLGGGSREEIIRGLNGIRFEYYDGLDWYDEWGDPDRRGKATSQQYQPNLEGMPEAVRITLWIQTTAKKRPTADESPAEPALVFQTVARLNLASINRTASESGTEQQEPASQGPTANNP